ncbi:hypothetical protein F5X97DRAFT_223280 [Nemania serpens]|nr:hypothetical protein F5X97DRAFT_223280 [Nemania serpens]
MTTPNVSSRRNSAATEMTVTDNTDNLAEKMASNSSWADSFEDDEKTLSNLVTKGTSSKYSKTGLSNAMAKLKSKLKTNEEKPVQKPAQKPPISPLYYPTARQTFEAIASSKM